MLLQLSSCLSLMTSCSTWHARRLSSLTPMQHTGNSSPSATGKLGAAALFPLCYRLSQQYVRIGVK